MKIKLMKYYFGIISALILTSCSTISGIGDAVGSINPFDRSDEKSKAAQGKVAGETDRISILELNETLKESENIKPEQIVLPPAFFSNSIFCFSVSCLSKLAKRLAIVLNNSASLAPTAMALSKSFKGADGFLSRG